MKRLSRGYKSSMDDYHLKEFREKFVNVTSSTTGIFYILCVLLSIVAATGTAGYILTEVDGAYLVLITYILLSFFISRQLRYLENVVHFCSHGNLSKNRRNNDLITNSLAAYPVVQEVNGYRKSQ